MFRFGVFVAAFTTIVALVLSEFVSNSGQIVGKQDDNVRIKRKANSDTPSLFIDGADNIARRSAHMLSLNVAKHRLRENLIELNGQQVERKRRSTYNKRQYPYKYGLTENLMERNRRSNYKKRHYHKYGLTDELLERKRRQEDNKKVPNMTKEAENVHPNTTEKSSNVIIEEVIFKRKREAPTDDMKRAISNDVGTGFGDDVIMRNTRDVDRVKSEPTTTPKSRFVIEDIVIFRKKRNSADVIEDQILHKNNGEHV